MITSAEVQAPSVSDEGLAEAVCTRIVPVILAGGSGTRLWPMSREHFPKQLIGVVGPDSLLQATVHRMEGFPSPWEVSCAPIIVCGDEHRFITVEQLRA